MLFSNTSPFKSYGVGSFNAMGLSSLQFREGLVFDESSPSGGFQETECLWGRKSAVCFLENSSEDELSWLLSRDTFFSLEMWFPSWLSDLSICVECFRLELFCLAKPSDLSELNLRMEEMDDT